jgi:hypothetical protein
MAARERCRFSLGFWRRSSDRRAFAARPISFGRNSMIGYRCTVTISQGLPARAPHCRRAKLTISASVAWGWAGPAQREPRGLAGSHQLCLAHLFDHLVDTHQQRQWQHYAERLRGLEIDHQLELGWVLHRQLGRLAALENAINIEPRSPPQVGGIVPIGKQTSDLGEVTIRVDRRELVLRCQFDDPIAMNLGDRIWHHNQTAYRGARKPIECAIDLRRVTHIDGS